VFDQVCSNESAHPLPSDITASSVLLMHEKLIAKGTSNLRALAVSGSRLLRSMMRALCMMDHSDRSAGVVQGVSAQELAGWSNPEQAFLPGVAENISGMTPLLTRSHRTTVWFGAAVAMLATAATAAQSANDTSATL